MVRFTVTLLTMLGLALGSTTSVAFSAPLCAAPGETSCSCGKAATASCCSTTPLTCCSGSQGSCCSQTSTESTVAGPSCVGCSCCLEPIETPLAPATASETPIPVDLLTWSVPLTPDFASPALPPCEREELHSGRTISLQVLHCRWLN